MENTYWWEYTKVDLKTLEKCYSALLAAKKIQEEELDLLKQEIFMTEGFLAVAKEDVKKQKDRELATESIVF